jgi:hypothetical protein
MHERMKTLWQIAWKTGPVAAAAALLLTVGCATDAVEDRRHDKWMEYSALPQDQREMVEQGQIRAGMSQEAVEIAWGLPTESLEADTDAGHVTLWRYEVGKKKKAAWTFLEIRRGGQSVLERRPLMKKDPRPQMGTEIEILRGRVLRWRSLPKLPD